jgi:hypothetical protein
MLGAAPAALVPDDHEFWNNYPHVAPLIPATFGAGGRARWTSAASALREAFQAHAAPGDPTSLEISVPPLELLFLDTRSDRQADKSRATSPAALAQLRAWSDRVRQAGRIGVLVAGQPLLAPRTSFLSGVFVDWALWDYGDAPAILQALVATGRPAVFVTGDVHWGRIARALDATSTPRVHEVVVSPAALVTTPVSDTLKEIGAFLEGLFGDPDPWPRHPKPEAPPAAVGGFGGAPRLRTAWNPAESQRGDQVAVLSFDWDLGKLRARVTWFPVRASEPARAPVEVFRLSLP